MPLHLRSKNLLRLCAMSVFALVASAPWAGHVRAQTVTLDSNQPIALTTSTTQSAVSINAATGDVVVRSLAQNTQCTQAAGPVIDSFVANPSTTAPGTNIALTWQSRNTTQCTGSQGGGTLWSSLGQLPANNTNGQSIAIPANTPNNSVITFQLNCSTAGGPVVSQTTTVNVQVIDPGTCAPIYPNANNSSWVGTFGPWPAFSGRSRVSGIPANGYQSWSFVAGSVVGLFGSVATRSMAMASVSCPSRVRPVASRLRHWVPIALGRPIGLRVSAGSKDLAPAVVC